MKKRTRVLTIQPRINPIHVFPTSEKHDVSTYDCPCRPTYKKVENTLIIVHNEFKEKQ